MLFDSLSILGDQVIAFWRPPPPPPKSNRSEWEWCVPDSDNLNCYICLPWMKKKIGSSPPVHCLNVLHMWGEVFKESPTYSTCTLVCIVDSSLYRLHTAIACISTNRLIWLQGHLLMRHVSSTETERKVALNAEICLNWWGVRKCEIQKRVWEKRWRI